MKVAVCIPTLNAGDLWEEFSAALKMQSLTPSKVLVIDSESCDGTPEMARQDGFEVVQIARCDFSHGGTRQRAAEMSSDCDVIVYLTQDSILASQNALQHLVSSFDDPMVGAAYGRQLPRRGATPIEAHARLFNYPSIPSVRSLKSIKELGIKAAFFSNSFGAYRRQSLDQVGGFPVAAGFGEDVLTVARMINQGLKIAYASDATVLHSHAFTLRGEYRRYVEIGSFHSREVWLRRDFGRSEGEGLRFISSELKFLWRTQPTAIPEAIIRSGLKYLGYRMGIAKGRTKQSG